VLELAQIDLAALAEALQDASDEHEWWFDPRTGEVVLWSEFYRELGEGHPEERDLRFIEPIGSEEAYRDMEDFVARVPDTRSRDRLARAIEGRGAFRRFRDALHDLPDEERQAWFAFRDARMERRALEWLADHGDVDRAAAEPAAARLGEDDRPIPLDARAVAEAVAGDLRRLYGDRLERVLLFGSQARGDAQADSDIDLLVVLRDMASSWEERRRMDEVLWRHSFANDTVVTALPVRSERLRPPDRPVLVRALAEGIELR
jgi:predicted nucleotidyltransferase